VAVTRVNRVTSDGFASGDPLAGIRPLFDTSSPLLRKASLVLGALLLEIDLVVMGWGHDYLHPLAE
jgi:hypothetical protein